MCRHERLAERSSQTDGDCVANLISSLAEASRKSHPVGKGLQTSTLPNGDQTPVYVMLDGPLSTHSHSKAVQTLAQWVELRGQLQILLATVLSDDGSIGQLDASAAFAWFNVAQAIETIVKGSEFRTVLDWLVGEVPVEGGGE